MSAFNHVEVKIPITGAPVMALGGSEGIVAVEPVSVSYWAWLYEGRFFETVTVFGPDHQNEALYAPFPEWLPLPPAWLMAAVDERGARAVPAREEKELEA